MVSYSSLCVYWPWPSSLRKLQVLLVVCSAFVIHVSIGTIYTYGNMVPYIVSYVRRRSHPADLDTNAAPYILTLQIAGQGLTMFVGGHLERRFGPRLVTLAGGLIMSLGLVLTYLTISVSYWLMLVTYGVIVGGGVGLAYIGPIACVMRWLPKWKGVSSGLVVAGIGLSALVFDPVQTVFVNPDNCVPTEEESGEYFFHQPELLDRVPYVFLVTGAIHVVMQVLGCIFLVNPEPDPQSETALTSSTHLLSPSRHPLQAGQDVGLQKHGATLLDTDESSRLRESHSATPGSESSSLLGSQYSEVSSLAPDKVHLHLGHKVFNLNPLMMLTKVNFYLLWVMLALGGVCVVFVNSLYKSFAFADVVADDHFLAGVGAVAAVFNMFGRIAWGLLADVVRSYKLAMTIHSACMTSLLFTLYATSGGRKYMFSVWFSAISFCVGGYYSLFPVATAREFGAKHFGVNYALVFTGQTVAGVVASLITASLPIHSDDDDWYVLFFVLGGLSAIQYIIVLCYRHKRYIFLRDPGVLQESASRRETSSFRFPIPQ